MFVGFLRVKRNESRLKGISLSRFEDEEEKGVVGGRQVGVARTSKLGIRTKFSQTIN